MQFSILNDEILCNYCGKYLKSMIHRHANVNIQIYQG